MIPFLFLLQVPQTATGATQAKANIQTATTTQVVLTIGKADPIHVVTDAEIKQKQYDKMMDNLRAAQKAEAEEAARVAAQKAAEEAQAAAALAAQQAQAQAVQTASVVTRVSSDVSTVLQHICTGESHCNYSTNTGNGYYGAYQFDVGTWGGFGGYTYASDAPASVQDAKAAATYAARGCSPWPNTCY